MQVELLSRITVTITSRFGKLKALRHSKGTSRFGKPFGLELMAERLKALRHSKGTSRFGKLKALRHSKGTSRFDKLKALRHSKGTSLDHVPLRAFGAGVGFPHPDAAKVGVAIVAQLGSGRQFVQNF